MVGEMTPRLAENAESYELVERARAGDREAFGQLFERYNQLVFGIVLRRVRNVEDARDLTSEVFLQVHAKLGSLREPKAFAGWLRSIASRMSINFLQRDGRRKGLPLFDPDLEPVGADWHEWTAPEILIARESSNAVPGMLDTLNGLHRRVVELFYIEGKSLNEMTRALSAEEGRDVPLGTVKRRLHVARKKLLDVARPLFDLDVA